MPTQAYKWRIFGAAANLLDLMQEHGVEIEENDPQLMNLLDETLESLTRAVLYLMEA